MPGIQGYTPADLARLRSVQVRPQGWSNATRDVVREYPHPKTGERIKLILDQAGNKVRMRKHGQDVRIYLPCLRIRSDVQETR